MCVCMVCGCFGAVQVLKNLINWKEIVKIFCGYNLQIPLDFFFSSGHLKSLVTLSTRTPLYKYYQIFILPPFLIITHKSNLHNLKRGFLPSIDAWSPKSGNLGQSNFTNPAVVCCVLLTTLLLSSSSFMLRLPSCLLSSVMVRNIVGVITNNYSILLARAVK